MNKSKIRKLEEKITYHKSLYYQGKPEISDEEYDKIEMDLRDLDPLNPVLALIGSPVDEGSEKIQHQKKMLSLEKTYDPNEINSYLEKGSLVSVFKIDGSSCSLVYENGHLKLGKTRGDGEQGENITYKIAYISDVPKKIEEMNNLEIRGEIYCKESSLHDLAIEMEALGLEKPTSQRNIVAGLLGRKEHVNLSRHLSFQAFDLIGLKFQSEEDKLKKISSLGFSVPEWSLHKTEKSIIERIEEAKQFMTNGDYLIDGLVFVINDISTQEELGETSHHPRYKKAFKFAGETKTTEIREITWQVSRNGILTPVAEIEPTELSGAMINRVTLHNFGIVSDFNLKPGDAIEIIRSGEVIPKFLSVKKSANGKASYPEKCPSCGKKILQAQIRLLCTNKDCPAQKIEKILHWIKQVNIEDLSEKRLQEMMSQGLVNSIADLYRLSVEDLLKLDKTKEKMAQKLFLNIQKSLKMNLVTFVSGIGLEGVSKTKAEKLISAGYKTIADIQKLDVNKIISIEGFAEKSAEDIVASLDEKRELINELLKVGVVINEAEKNLSTKLQDLKICITGTLSVPRAEIEKLIKLHGGHVVSSVSKNTNLLITNDTDPTSTKYKKALDLGIDVISEEAFLNRVGV
ncbi:MAG: NAD-dependent DNA ligase LigA [Bacteriovoracaceae bacterium]|nr:NAD-dependent DNA ligase LigA [Bacteriovoracaceae bacterium]